MKRLFLSAALLPLLYAGAGQAETVISTATKAPVKTSTLANGQPDSLKIDTGGSISPEAAGVAVTMDAQQAVTNLGSITFGDGSDMTGVLLMGGAGGTLTNTGTISLLESYVAEDADKDGDLDGPFAKGVRRYGVRAVGAQPFTGDVRNNGAITVEGDDSAGILLETRLFGSLVQAGTVAVTGDRSVGVSAFSVSGDVRLTGAVSVVGEGAVGVNLGRIDGGLVLQNAVMATGYRYTDRLATDVRAKLDADDLKQGGGAVRLTGDIARGVLLDRPPADLDPKVEDEDGDGVADAAEATAVLTAYGSAAALDIGGAQAITLGAVGTGDLAFGLVNKGQIAGLGINDGVAATALRIGQAGGAAVVVQGGVNNLGGAVRAQSYGAEASGVLINSGAVVQTLRNTGSISAEQTGGRHDAQAVIDRSGSLGLIENAGTIRAVVNGVAGETATGKAVAIDLSANVAGAVVRQTAVTGANAPLIEGEVRFGSGADRLELLGGSLRGAMDFGAGADSFVIDGAATATGRLTDADGRLSIDVRDGRLAVTNAETVNLTALNVGAKGVLAVTLDPKANTATRFQVAGAATLADGAQLDVGLNSLLRGSRSFQVLQARSLQAGQTGVKLIDAPFLYQADLRADQAVGALYIDLRPKTSTELGLNRSGAQAYSAVFDVLDRNAAIEQAFLAQTGADGFHDIYDQMLPDHSGGALMSAAAISGAVSSATAAPQGIDPPGGQGAWVQEIAFDIRRDRQAAAGFKSRGFGLAGGLDLLGEQNAVGITTNFVTTDYRDKGAASGEQVSMNVFGGGLYWRLDMGAFQAHARGGLGYGWFNGERRLSGPNLDLTAKADWNGWMADAHMGASYTLEAGRFYVRPEVSLDYVRLSEGGYQERGGGDGFDLKVASRKGDLLTGQGLVAFGARFGDEVYWAPELKVGWRARLAGDPGRTTAHFKDGADFVLDPEQPFKDAAIMRVGLRGGSSRLLIGIDAGGAVETSYREYDLRAVIRYQF